MELTYWMNRLQSWIPKSIPVFVTLNPSRPPAKEKTYGSFTYHHPVYSLASLEAQRKVERIQGENNTYFAGAHLGFGFHEDGFTHALLVAQSISTSNPLMIITVACCGLTPTTQPVKHLLKFRGSVTQQQRNPTLQ